MSDRAVAGHRPTLNCCRACFLVKEHFVTSLPAMHYPCRADSSRLLQMQWWSPRSSSVLDWHGFHLQLAIASSNAPVTTLLRILTENFKLRNLRCLQAQVLLPNSQACNLEDSSCEDLLEKQMRLEQICSSYNRTVTTNDGTVM